jgi:carbamoyltransferase
MIAGISGGRRHGAAAFADTHRLIGVCSQERVTRVRGAGVGASGLPDESMNLLFERTGRTRKDISRHVAVDVRDSVARSEGPFEQIDEHYAHACTAYLTSGFTSAAIVVCDHEPPEVSVYAGEGATIRRIDCPPFRSGFATVYSRCAAALGFAPGTGDQQFEALARLQSGHRDTQVDKLLTLVDGSLVADAALERRIEERLSSDADSGFRSRSAMAAALQARLGELLIEFLRQVAGQVGSSSLCVGGSLFYHSSINTMVEQSGLFRDVFVPVDPGNSGLAVGAACHGLGADPALASPFLGPCYAAQEIKETLDNCKLQYAWESEEGTIAAAVNALQQGYLVGWFDGPMEWGPRALGARSIFASPASPYVLENLNRFLKRRDSWRGYAISGLEEVVADHFAGPRTAPFMEYDYRPHDGAQFQHILPAAGAAIRVHTVADREGTGRLRRLLEAFGRATGLPFLVNTSFNGFHEPIVCSPRDAVRVFYGTGLDILICNPFILRK